MTNPPTITLQNLTKALADAYEAGFHGALEMKNSHVEEIISKLISAKTEENTDWKVYKVRELIEIPTGTIFEHRTKGKGWIEQHGSYKRMWFEDGSSATFSSDAAPWNEPMRILGTIQKQGKPCMKL